MDIHEPTDQAQLPPGARFEILEAGTGHGGLTLHLARAIHGFNPPLVDGDAVKVPGSNIGEALPLTTGSEQEEDSSSPSPTSEPDSDSKLEHWRKTRKAIIHSLDISAINSAHASQIVKNFRRGLYAGDVDFYVGDVSEWISKELLTRSETSEGQQSGSFLSHVLLDLPSPQAHLEHVASALHVDGVLTVFNPSITQIATCVEVIREKRLPFVLDQVLELGPGMTGGREWSVQSVKPRALIQAQAEQKKALDSASEQADVFADSSGATTREQEQAHPTAGKNEGWEMICRPKVGGRISGGGFLGVWRRMRYRRPRDQIDVASSSPASSSAD